MAIYPKHREGLTLKARVYLSTNRFDDGVRLYDENPHMFPRPREEAWGKEAKRRLLIYVALLIECEMFETALVAIEKVLLGLENRGGDAHLSHMKAMLLGVLYRPREGFQDVVIAMEQVSEDGETLTMMRYNALALRDCLYFSSLYKNPGITLCSLFLHTTRH